MKPTSPFAWFGGKQRLATKIVALLPPHRIYVEVFGGGGAVIFHKPPAPHLDVYNDIDDGLVNFFRVLREQPEELVTQLRLTPYALEEFRFDQETWRKCADPVEKARRWFTMINLRFSSENNRFKDGWKAGTVVNHPKTFATRVDDLFRFAEKLRRIQVEKRSWEEVFDLYDSEDTCFYCDPPYLPSTRKSGRYAHELTYSQHKMLLERILRLQGSVLISGYDNKLYRETLEPAGFERYEFTMPLIANAVKSEKREDRLEVVWRKAQTDLRLFDATA